MANGVAVGAVLFLMASGLALLIGAMGVLNLAHGAVYMVGAYLGWWIAIDQGLPFPLAIVGAAGGAALLGLVLERLYRQISGLPDEQILLSFGLVFVLSNLVQWVWGPVAKAPFRISWLDGAVDIGSVAIPTVRFVIALVGFAVAIVLWLVQERTRAGAIVRAGMDNPNMVRALGIDLDRVVVGVFVLGSAVAGIAGATGGLVLGASSSQSIDVLLLALVVVVVGGVGSVAGTLGAAMLMNVRAAAIAPAVLSRR